ncbi:MAG TPA: CaiB/BaiF CoA-transferase family protein [Actinomycetota bacterium]|nr:CaiB/BaiF CoA-transferase family protein [Actinomycetota bacterium]
MTRGPLEGLVVADLSRVLAGPFTTMLLGDLGADVVKVEHPDGGDETRAWGPPFYGDHSTYYLAVNRNKRSVALDLKTEAGRRAARALAGRADVLVENFKAGALDRVGLGYEEVARDNPGLVWCSISGFGRGAGAELPGYDFLVQAMSGLMSITGPAGGEPTKVGVALVDVLTGLYATTGILAALQERARTGRGQRVEVSLLGSALASLVNQASSFLCTGAPPRAMGNRHPSITPYETLATADRPLVVAVGNDGQFARLCRAVGRDELAGDPRFATNVDRVANRDELAALLEEALAARGAADWVAALAEAGVPCGLVNDVGEAFALAERLGLGPVADAGGVPQVASPIGLSATPVAYRLAPPALGQHTAEVLAWLGTAP